MANVGPSAQKNAVCTYFHRTSVVADGKLLKGKKWICNASFFLNCPQNYTLILKTLYFFEVFSLLNKD